MKLFSTVFALAAARYVKVEADPAEVDSKAHMMVSSFGDIETPAEEEKPISLVQVSEAVVLDQDPSTPEIEAPAAAEELVQEKQAQAAEEKAATDAKKTMEVSAEAETTATMDAQQEAAQLAEAIQSAAAPQVIEGSAMVQTTDTSAMEARLRALEEQIAAVKELGMQQLEEVRHVQERLPGAPSLQANLLQVVSDLKGSNKADPLDAIASAAGGISSSVANTLRPGYWANVFITMEGDYPYQCKCIPSPPGYQTNVTMDRDDKAYADEHFADASGTVGVCSHDKRKACKIFSSAFGSSAGLAFVLLLAWRM